MRRLCIILFFLSIAPVVVYSQNLHLTAFAGFSNYQGDLQDKRFTINQAHPALGAGLLYEITEKFSARANITFGKVSGDDKNNTKNSSRNLNFTSAITDVQLGLEYDLFSLYEKSITPYVFAGLSYFNFNPYTKDTAGRTIFLQP